MSELFNIAYDPDTINDFNRALKTYVTELGMEQNKVIKQWSGNLAENLMMETPPFAQGRKASNGLDARKRGISKIEKDLKMAVNTTEQLFGSNIRSEGLQKILKSRDRKRLQGFLEHAGYTNWEAVKFDERLHTEKRPTMFNKIRPQDKVTFEKQNWNRYLKKLQDRVGWMKAGWAVAAQALGKKVPAWIAKHIGYARGSLKTEETSGGISYTIENYSPTIGRYGGRFNHAISWMFDKMQKDIKARLDYIARKKNGQL